MNLQQSVDLLKKFSNQFKAVIEVGEYLENIASLEQAWNEAKSRLEAIKAEEEKELDGLANLKKELEHLRLEIESKKIKASEIENSAKKEAEKILKESEEKARLNLEKMKERNREIEKENTLLISSSKNELASLNDQIERKKQELNLLLSNIQNLKKSITEIPV